MRLFTFILFCVFTFSSCNQNGLKSNAQNVDPIDALGNKSEKENNFQGVDSNRITSDTLNVNNEKVVDE